MYQNKNALDSAPLEAERKKVTATYEDIKGTVILYDTDAKASSDYD